MLYDLAREPPEPGTLLESVFMLLAKMRQESRFLETRVLIEAVLRPHVKDGDSFQKAYRDYADSVFPFAAEDRRKEKQAVKKAMQQWTAHRAFKVKPLGLGNEGRALRSKLKKAAEKVMNQKRAPGRRIG